MGGNVSARACSLCKNRKVKCSRSLPTCRQCDKSGTTCVYPEHNPIRFRDNTQSASLRAVQQWRSRCKKAPLPLDAPVQRVICPPLEDLARQRFLHDFADTNTSPFSRFLQKLVLQWANSVQGTDGRTGLEYALNAVALANFSRRHGDITASSLAVQTHVLAAKFLKNDLRDQAGALTYQDALVAVLLGLFQSIYQEQDMTGFWVHHFCGTVHILSQLHDHTPEKLHLSRLITTQAFYASLRMDHFIRLPAELQAWLRDGTTIEVRTMRLAYRTIEFCLKYKCHGSGPFHVPETDLAQALLLDCKLKSLESELSVRLPYVSTHIEPDEYPQWYKPVSMHAGCPDSTHVYDTPVAAAVWNLYRIAHLKLLVWMLKFGMSYLSMETRLDVLEAALAVVHESAASFYFTMVQTGSGRPAPTSFDNVPSSVGYTLHLKLLTLRDCITSVPMLVAGVGWLTVDWLETTVRTISERLGISEALCWEDANAQERAKMLKKLTFEDSGELRCEELEGDS